MSKRPTYPKSIPEAYVPKQDLDNCLVCNHHAAFHAITGECRVQLLLKTPGELTTPCLCPQLELAEDEYEYD